MAQRSEKVQARVRQELSKNPGLGSGALYEIAKDVDKSIVGESLQQFHARYVLPIKREEAKKRGGGRAKRPRKARGTKATAATKAPQPSAAPARSRGAPKTNGRSDRDRVRGVLLEFARDFAQAESRSDLVQVLSRVDEYVDRIVPRG